MSVQFIACPDIGGFKDVSVIEVLVKAGDVIALETPLVTLETDKATMDVPASLAGRVVEVLITKASKVSQGTPLVKVEAEAAKKKKEDDDRADREWTKGNVLSGRVGQHPVYKRLPRLLP